MSPEHLPVGVATQNEELRKRFRGRSEYLVNFFTFLAQEVREYLAEIGVGTPGRHHWNVQTLIVRKPGMTESGTSVDKLRQTTGTRRQ